MTILPRLIVLIFGQILFSCTNPNGTPEVRKDIRVLIVGNSIVKHAPAPEIGWYGDWGMAATSPENDFVRVYTRLLQDADKYNSVVVDAKNIGHWEVDFSYDLNQYDDVSGKRYDVFIVRLGENVRNTTDYYDALVNMINHFRHSETKVIITGMVWEHILKESIQQQVASDNHFKFISMSDFHHDLGNFSFGLFENSGVAGHPSDIGMRNIAESLLKSTLEIF